MHRFSFLSILIMTQLISFLHFLLTAIKTGRLGVLPIKIYRGNNAVFVPVSYGGGGEDAGGLSREYVLGIPSVS